MPYFHVQAFVKSDPKREEWEMDLSKDALDKRFLERYTAGQPIGVNGKWISLSDLDRVRIYESDAPAKLLGQQYRERTRDSNVLSFRNSKYDGIEAAGREVTSKLLTGPPGTGQAAALGPESHSSTLVAGDSAAVFVVHGRNSAVRDAMFSFLRAIELKPIEWSEAVLATGHATPYIGDVLDAAFSQAQAVVVLLTPDDEARLRSEFAQAGDPPHEVNLSGQARPNVLFEAGMAMGRDPGRTVLVEIGVLRRFSDIAGRHVVRFDGSSQRRQKLAQRLQSAGCEVNLSGTDWHTAGDFGIE